MSSPRVTIAIPTYNRDRFLAEAIESCLAQDHDDFEVLVVDDGSTNPVVGEVIARYTDDRRLRVIMHETNRGLAAANNTAMREARGELFARLGDDDICFLDRIRRQAAVFDTHPDTGVVYGDAVVIDERGHPTGSWAVGDYDRRALLDLFLRRQNFIVDPSTMIHRRVLDALGGWNTGYRICEDFEFWLRAVDRFRFRHCPGGPLIRYRRHGQNLSGEAALELQVGLVSRAIEEAMERYDLEDLVPELDWGAGEPGEDRRRALLLLADAFDERGLPLHDLARRVRDRALEGRRRIMLTSFGYNDSGGGTIVPRYLSRELARRGWDVTVFHAAVGRVDSPDPYQVRRWEADGVRLIGVYNRPHGLLDLGNPGREIDDPPITRAFAEALDRHRPDVVHFHNLHNLGAALLDQTAVRGIPAYFSTHNYWLLCPRNYLYTETLELCHGPENGGGDCAACVHSPDVRSHQERLSEIRSRFSRGVTACLAVSQAMRQTLITAGYPAEMIDVVRQAMPEERTVWEAVGRDRAPGRIGDRLTVGFFGSAYPHKGPSLLVEAAQRTAAEIRVVVHGDVPPAFAEHLRALDARGVVEIRGGFDHDHLPGLLAEVDVAVIPSLWWDCAPLVVSECLAGRVPVLAARMGGIPDFVRHEVNGLLFEGRSRDDLTRQLDRLAGEEGLLERLQAGIEPPGEFARYVDELERYYAGRRPAAAARRAPLTVRWRGDQLGATSLATINRQVSERLSREPGIGLERIGRGGESHDASLPHPGEVEVRHQWPYDFGPSASRLAVIQPWEFGAVPLEWIDPIRRNVDEVWVPSEYVRRMYLDGGVAPERVVVVPNGVDLDTFTPVGPRLDLDAPDGVRFLFVGGMIERKGPDLLLAAYLDAFQGRDDVTLVVKDFGADTIYPGSDRSRLQEYSRDKRLPRVVYLHDDMDEAELAALYRACDVLVLPYRGEGFAMPALEGMASGLPVIVTAGGPTDEFVPDAASWRIPAQLRPKPENLVDHWVTASRPFMLEPDLLELRRLMAEAASDADGRRARGAAGRAAAERYSWDSVAALYAERLRELGERPPRHATPDVQPFPLEGDASRRLLATPAWLGHDRLEELLAAWVAGTCPGDDVSLHLIADPRVGGSADECAARVLSAARRADVDLEGGADIGIVVQPLREGTDASLHAAADGYVVLHGACEGHVRLARRAGNAVLQPGDVATWVAAAVRPAA